jgi:hypothetical protein
MFYELVWMLDWIECFEMKSLEGERKKLEI